MHTTLTETDLNSDLKAVFTKQRQFAPLMALTTASQRIERIRRIQTWMLSHQSDLEKAMFDDFRKPTAEVGLGELMAVNAEIKHIIKNLKRWMRPQKLPTPLSMVGMRSSIRHEPKGNVLIFSAWNYPFALIMKPLVSAIAAGNVCVVKPSEMAPNTARFMSRMIGELFPIEEVAIFEGDAVLSQALLELPFNHVFFTGSPAVGKLVMAAAAKHLTSVTLELGGKSPSIVDETANLKTAAEQIAWGKYLNNGQTCIAPDYVLIHQSVKEPFLAEFRRVVTRMYNADGQGVEASDSYARIVNNRHFERVRSLLDNAVEQGARITMGGTLNDSQNFIEPTVLEGVTDGMRIMQEEIFGPVLPVVTFSTPDEALALINGKEKPLALYIHSRNRQNIDYILARTSAGDTIINDVMLQFGNVELPFGGVNNSGIGKSNGFFSFQELSNQRGVMERSFGTMKFLYPPYTDRVKQLINFVIKRL
ncbi:aldehyde dehydrogenase family protein [Spirosoma utsteinense]|uniref:Aldehyde dehydrogenase n=1 Tax=Spirosoma utsteinense TaxID=2585773 RepID=A0ABR6VZI2_9BACT|nr:aldehyde dehydrogenase family protein [Spirosoma utsteinense]MBC3784602.1 aldehyde dehydrogenase (NAD+) [Spirosoma utsteinense]MBC3789645.1 aldehyde dehydrogenase (NAD+) [Spirosoma utsteinense]